MEGKRLEWPLIYIRKWAVSTDRNIASHSRFLELILCVRSVVFFPGLGLIQPLGGLFPTAAAHWRHRCVLSLLERLILCHLCDCMHQISQSAFSVIGIRKDKKIAASRQLLHLLYLILRFVRCVQKPPSLLPVSACWCHHFPPSLNTKNPDLFTLAFSLDGISVMSHQIDIWVAFDSSGEFFYSGCRPNSASSQIWVLIVSAMMNRPHLLYRKPSLHIVAWSSPCTSYIWHCPLDSCAGKRPPQVAHLHGAAALVCAALHSRMLLRCRMHELFPPRIEIHYVEIWPEP